MDNLANQINPVSKPIVSDIEKYHNPNKRCTYPFTPDAIGYCWSYAHHVDGNPAFTDIESRCKHCEMWKNEELKQCCNHCMAVFSEELTSCPECGKDDALMFPLVGNSSHFLFAEKNGSNLV